MEPGKADRRKRLDNDATRSKSVAIACRDVHGPEGIVKDEDAHTRFGSIDQNLGERVGHPAGRTVVQLKSD
jgi:hypothetical protein